MKTLGENAPRKKRTRKDKYFVLRGQRRGEILEAAIEDARTSGATSDTIALRSDETDQADFPLVDVQMISDEVADLLSAVASPRERISVLDRGQFLDAIRTGIEEGSHVLVKMANGYQAPGVVLYRGFVSPASGTLFAVQLKVRLYPTFTIEYEVECCHGLRGVRLTQNSQE